MALDQDVARRKLEIAIGAPARDGNEITRLRNGVEIFPAMIEAIRGAERTVDLLSFVYWTGAPAREVAEALKERARADVRVRVILDAMGARHMPDEIVEELEGAGVELRWFRDVLDDADKLDANHRTHRKVLVVDARVGFLGGVGIAEEWAGDAGGPDEWRDDHFRIVGPAVESMRAAFLDDWAEDPDCDLFDEHDVLDPPEEVGDVPIMVIRSESERGYNDIALAKRLLIGMAEERIRITSAYFSPNEVMAGWLVDARERGVEVEVLMPGEHTDKRIPQVSGEASYEMLLDAGVVIRRYERTMLHAKIMTVDGVVSNIGSANYNMRSMRQDEELDAIVFDTGLATQLDEDWDEDVTHAVEVDPAEWEERGMFQRAQEQAIELIDRWV